MKRILGVLTPKASMLKTVFLALFVLAPLVSAPAPASAQAKAWYVAVNDVYARRGPQSYAIGRLYKDQRMDISYIDSNGWAWGQMYGYVGDKRCGWAQFSLADGTRNFWTHGTTVANNCGSPRWLYDYEWTNGEIWKDPWSDDGVAQRLGANSYRWDNWSWGNMWGNHKYRGIAYKGEVWRIRYTTNDGAGVMARGPCWWTGTTWACYKDWQFIQRASL